MTGGPFVLGVDGGGSTVRVVVCQADLTPVGNSQDGTVNPNVAGREQARDTLQQAMRAAISNAGLTTSDISAVGIGVAGAEASHSEAWLRTVVGGVTPHAHCAASADHEIALIGAHGGQNGLLVLAGTGSLACGVGSTGEYVVVGARGYLLGDEGSGYWIGMEGLRAIIRADDGRGQDTNLTERILGVLSLNEVEEIVPWLYHSGVTRTREVAQLAGHVLDAAGAGDRVAQEIVRRATQELALALRAVRLRLNMEPLPVAFAGGLLTSDTLLGRSLCAALGLPEVPLAKYPAVIGAAILALRKIGGLKPNP